MGDSFFYPFFVFRSNKHCDSAAVPYVNTDIAFTPDLAILETAGLPAFNLSPFIRVLFQEMDSPACNCECCGFFGHLSFRMLAFSPFFYNW